MSDVQVTGFGIPGDPVLQQELALEFQRELLIWAIKGKGARGRFLCGNRAFEAHGVLRFNGDLHNPEWTWQTDQLAKLPLSELRHLYLEVR